MIVRRSEGSQLLITQPDHAALAGRVMECWTAGALQRSPRRAEIFLAIYEHDNGWREPDAEAIIDSNGKIVDFVHAPDDLRHALWLRGIERLADTPYAAALVAQHAIHVYDRKRADPSWTPFFEDMEAARARHLRRTTVSLEELWFDYGFVRLADLISLTFCNGWRDQTQDHGGHSVQGDQHGVIVTPDPFGSARVSLEVSGVEIADVPFTSSRDAVEAVKHGRRVLLSGMARGG